MRLDRLATLYLARPLMASARRESSSALPILMYHSISDTHEDVAPYYRVCTSPAAFARQITFIARNGYQTLTLDQAQQFLHKGRDLSKFVVITFDDGFRDFYMNAFPILMEHGFTATMYLPTSFISGQRRAFKDRECLTWSEVREMRQAGICFGSHTVNHPKLVTLDWPRINDELRDSRAEIEQQLGSEISHFAYPYAFPQANGEFSAHFRDCLEQHGYRTCVTTELGRVTAQDDAFRWKRLPANSCDDLDLLQAKLAGAYDWMRWPQTAIKSLKTALSPS
jgi:peptidoglycan/xylan/chitin deacetylase (PgdA/CDA1 family)